MNNHEAFSQEAFGLLIAERHFCRLDEFLRNSTLPLDQKLREVQEYIDAVLEECNRIRQQQEAHTAQIRDWISNTPPPRYYRVRVPRPPPHVPRSTPEHHDSEDDG